MNLKSLSSPLLQRSREVALMVKRRAWSLWSRNESESGSVSQGRKRSRQSRQEACVKAGGERESRQEVCRESRPEACIKAGSESACMSQGRKCECRSSSLCDALVLHLCCGPGMSSADLTPQT